MLDALLGCAPHVVGVGELNSGWRRYEAECSCGETIRRCAFWRRVRSEFETFADKSWDEAGYHSQYQSHIFRYVSTLLSTPKSDSVIGLRAITEHAIAAIKEVSKASIVVDSSKETTRALFIARFVPEARLIHLVRRPDAVIASHMKRIREGSGFKFLRRSYKQRWLEPVFLTVVAISWLVGNMLAAIACRYAPGRCIRVRYEDLCSDPRSELEKIGGFLGIDMETVIAAVESGQSLPIGHKIAGNRMRNSSAFTFQPTKAHSRPVPAYYRLAARMMGWPLTWRYGYFGRDST